MHSRCVCKYYVRMNLEFLENVLPLVWCADKRTKAEETVTTALPLNTLAQPDATAKHTHTTHIDYARHTLQRKQICLCLLAHSHPSARPPAQSQILQFSPPPSQSIFLTHRFLILLFGAFRFLGFLNDCVERETQAAHAGQVGHVYVKLQLLIPHRLRAHRHIQARHHLAEQIAAVEQTGLHHKLQGKRTQTPSGD